MTLTDRHLDELKRERWRDFEAEVERYLPLLAGRGFGIVAPAVRAARNHDSLTVCAIGEALIRAGVLGLKPLRSTGFIGVLHRTLVEEGRYDAALKVFDSLTEEDLGRAKVWVVRARALIGLGQVEGARAAIARALEINPEVRGGRELKALLVERRKLRAKLDGNRMSWADLRRLVEVHQELGMRDVAAKLIKNRMPLLPEPTPDDYDDGVRLLQAALRLLGPEAAVRLGAGLGGVRQDHRLKALTAECRIALGLAEEAAGADTGGRGVRLQRAIAVAETGRLEEAIERLGRMTVKLKEDLEVRAALGFYVGRRVLEENPLALRPPDGPRRIFNLMPFNDEFSLLKFHLAEMSGWVDKFVIVESRVTFTGKSKPLYFERNKSSFAQYADKILHVVVPDHPAAFHSPWGRDFRQRDMAVTALSGLASPDDLVLLTDVDEIVDRRALEGFNGDLAGLRMAMFRFFLNYRPAPENDPVRRTGAVVKAGLLQRFGSSYIRFDLARRKDGQLIDNAGWHFNSICDAARLVAKVNSYAHQERGDDWRDVGTVDARLSSIKNGEFEDGWERAEVDETFPAYVRKHQGRLGDLLISAPAKQASEA